MTDAAAPTREEATLTRGDTLPWTRLETTVGGRTAIGEGSLHGLPIVLWIAGAGPSRLGAEALARRLGAFREVAAMPFIVVSEALGGSGSLPSTLSDLVLIDADRRIAPAVGLEGEGVVVLDGGGRIVLARAGLTLEMVLDEALRECTEIFNRTARAEVRAHAPVLIVHDVLEAPLCRRLIDYWHAAEHKVVNDVADAPLGASSERIKRRTDVTVADPLLAETLRSRLRGRLVPQMQKAFNFRVAMYQKIRIGRYDSAELGFFTRHRDNDFACPDAGRSPKRLRQFALTLNLNDPSEYEGGELWFPEYGRQLYKPDVGAAVVFSASLLHEALPVVSGRRFMIVGFFYDAANAVLFRQETSAEAPTE